MPNKFLLLSGLRSMILRKLLPGPLVSEAILVTQRQGAHSRAGPQSGLTRAEFRVKLWAVGSSNEART